MTLTERARQVAVSIAYLSRIERDRENPPPDHLVAALARALDLPADNAFAAASRLPPVMRARAGHVIALYRLQGSRIRRFSGTFCSRCLYRGSRITFDDGLLTDRVFDDVLGLTDLARQVLSDAHRGKNTARCRREANCFERTRDHHNRKNNP